MRLLPALLLILLALPGCGGDSAPVSLNEIPIEPGLTVYEGAEETALDNAIMATESAFGVGPKKAEIQYLWMPETVNREQVDRFYRSALAEGGWDMDDAAAPGMGRWKRNSSAGQQVLVLNAVPVTSGDGHIMIIILAEEA